MPVVCAKLTRVSPGVKLKTPWVGSAAYTINFPQVAAPVFNPAGGTFASALSVTITTTTGGASIRYTTDGSTPSETIGTIYSTAVAVSSTTTLKAIAYGAGMIDSAISSAAYTINLPQVAAPVFNPAGGTFTSAQSVTITTTTGGASIRYTTDGSTPTSSIGSLHRSEEHTSELQSPCNLACRLLLE